MDEEESECELKGEHVAERIMFEDANVTHWYCEACGAEWWDERREREGDRMSEPRLLDLFCGAGGCTKGYQRAGFYVVGVDLEPQPHYCGDEFVKGDALAFLAGLSQPRYQWPGERFAAIHASPVCKLWSQVTRTNAAAIEHPDLIAPLRPLLEASGLPYVIENVPEAPLLTPIMLCGSMFDLDVRRHRNFETNWNLPNHHWPCRHRIWSPRFAPNRSDRARNPNSRASVISVAGHGSSGYGGKVADWRRAMEIDWMTRDELAQAIPPAYTEWIGARLLASLPERSAA